jgi:cytoskeletal protein CcmA (bactofilin family)
MRSIIVPIMIAALILSAGLCPAAGFEGGDVVVVSIPIGDDLYVAGGKVILSEPAAGDVVAAGGSLIINGPVGADLQVAGGSLLVNSPVKDDLRAAVGDMVLSSTVGGDLVVFGGNVTIPAGAVVEGDAVIAAGSLHLGGIVRGDLLVNVGSLDLTGTVQGDAKLYAADEININGSVQGDTIFTGPEAKLGPGARFGKDVSYWREGGEIDFGQVPVGGQVLFNPELKGKGGHYTNISAKRHVDRGSKGFFFGTMLSGILVIVLSVLLFKGIFRLAGEALHRSYWQSTGIGILVYLLLPLAGFLAFITVLGIPVGMLLLALFAFSLIFGAVIAAMAFAAWLERRRVAEWSTGRLLLVSIGLYIAIKLLSVVPFIGWLAALFVVLAGYGALVLGLWRARPAV